MKRTKDINLLADHLRRGGLVAFPTETVYGLGGDARSDDAVAAIYAAKDRPQFNPLIVHVESSSAAKKFAQFNDSASKLANQFWPGPLTLVVPRRKDCKISLLASAGLNSLALRVPAHPLAQHLLQQFNGPLVAPSANPSGQISPTSADHVIAGLDGKVEYVLDGGECTVGLESTIISCLGDTPVILRHGGLARAEVERALGLEIHSHQDAPAKPSAPGQLISHYAPNASMRLNATSVTDDEALLGFGDVGPQAVLNLSPTANLQEAAANLFAMMRQLDSTGVKNIAVSPIPNHGLGEAINDRLTRAAAPRPDKSKVKRKDKCKENI